VPDGATMVGNPARQVGRRDMATEPPPGFEPYGVSGEMPDPVARALNALLDEVQTLRARVGELENGRQEGAAPTTPPDRPARRRSARAEP